MSPFASHLAAKRLKKWSCACAIAWLCAAACGGAQAATALESDAVQLPPAVALLMQQAEEDERGSDVHEGMWQAANRYCAASRLGSTEAQFRLGMLFAFGRGVPESRDIAASLFSSASLQGHALAHAMLDTIRMTSHNLPQCVLEDVPPPMGARPQKDFVGVAGIDKQLDSLPKNRRWIVDLVGTQARWNAVDPRLILSIIAAESNFETSATSPKSAMGLMQLIPQTAERFNVLNAYNATQNIKAGLSYVRWLLSYYQGDVKLALAAYNAGEGNVDKYKGVPPCK